MSLQPQASPPACVHLHYYTPVECPSTGGPHTREWVLTDIADSTQLGTRERVRAKVRKIQATRTVAATGDGRRDESEGRVREAERRAREAESDIKREKEIAEHQAREAGRQVRAMEDRAREAERRVGDAEREKEDIKREKDIADHQVKEAEGRAREAERQVQAMEDRAREAERRVGDAEREKEDIKRGKDIAEHQVKEAEGRAREAEGQAREAEDQAREAEDRAREAERGKEAAENRQRGAEQRLVESEGKLRRLETRWVVERREIQLTDEELGRGAWATVSVAIFRGACVAAKCVHNQIVSPHNIQLFKREMDMAARIRHPNLLLFIGATLEGEMVILTELMPTSLRRELQREYQLSLRPTISIGLDVARALNYLHLMRPHPLIHRDISSANILLEPLPNGRWRAKVSDYGTVNLQENLATVGPGSPCYAAPEANNPTQQSPKMDIFSFGALLMEMLSGELTANRCVHA